MKILSDSEYKKLVNAYNELENIKAAKPVPNKDSCNFVFNFNDPLVRAFSVERLDWDTPNERTVIGYAFTGITESKSTTKIEEWSFHCSREHHNQLAEEFKAFLKKE